MTSESLFIINTFCANKTPYIFFSEKFCSKMSSLAVVNLQQTNSQQVAITININVGSLRCNNCGCVIEDEEYLRKLSKCFDLDLPYCVEKRARLVASHALSYALKIGHIQVDSLTISKNVVCCYCLGTLLLSCKLQHGIYETTLCPFGNFVKAKKCFSLLRVADIKHFKEKIRDFEIDLDHFRYYCPCNIGKKPCNMYTIFKKNGATPTHTFCEHHGMRCILCYEQMDNDHISHCCGYPKSVITKSSVEFARCPRCLVIVVKDANDGCENLTCNCGQRFLLGRNKFTPTNLKIVPLKSEIESEAGMDDFWYMKKQRNPRSDY